MKIIFGILLAVSCWAQATANLPITITFIPKTCNVAKGESVVGINAQGVLQCGVVSVTSSVASFTAGFALIPDSTGKIGLNTALAPSNDMIETGVMQRCVSSAGTIAYRCSMTKALVAYTAWMFVWLIADVPCASACTLNIDNVGTVAIKQVDGTTDAKLTKGPHLVIFDSAVFRLML